MAVVTARLFVPNQGGMIAPKPPAGPPAAITSRFSGTTKALYETTPLPLITAVFHPRLRMPYVLKIPQKIRGKDFYATLQ